MEVDERLRWLESRISSSLRPRGEELRTLFSDEENRAAFLAFCNHSEARRLFVYLSPHDEGDEGGITVSSMPPKRISDKALFFIKCGHASKLSRESIGHDVVYSECSSLPLEHLELVTREVYLPLISSQIPVHSGVSGDKLMDLMHRLVATVQVTKGFCDGRVALPLPSIEVLAEAAMNNDRKAAVIHVLESSVVSWMKQVKIAMLLDPNSTIIKTHGKYAGPLAETEFWSRRLSRLDSVRSQLSSVVVLNILHNLEQAHSTYAQAFIHVHRDVGKAIVDCEHYLMYLNTLQPWFLRLNQAFNPDSIMKLFPPTIKTLLLVWQHSRFYSSGAHFHRVLHLLSNEVMLKAKEIVGEDILENPEISLLNIKLALRLCAAFRGCYLDFKERAEAILHSQREKREQALHSEMDQHSYSSSNSVRNSTQVVPGSFIPTSLSPAGKDAERLKDGSFSDSSVSGGVLCPWPPRNSPVFAPLNGIMERCNDLLDLVQTVHDFRELDLSSCDGSINSSQSSRGTPLIIDIYSNFTSLMSSFRRETQDLLSLEDDSSFEEHFFHFRSSVKGFERQLVDTLDQILDHTPSLQAKLRVLELFQGVFKREAIMSHLQPQFEDIVTKLHAEVSSALDTLSAHMATPPLLPHTPPIATKLLWLKALRERVSGPLEKVREVAPYLLEGDQGWKLRQLHGQALTKIDEHTGQTQASWLHSVSPGLSKRLKGNVLVRSGDGRLEVNVDPFLVEVLSEVHHLSRAPLSVRLPASLRQLSRTVDFRQLKHRNTSLEVVVESYNELQSSLSEVEKMLFQHKLQETEKLVAVGLENLDWTSANFPDFVAKTRAAVCVELQSTLLAVRQHTQSIRSIAEGWSKTSGIDLFSEERGDTRLKAIEKKHNELMEGLRSLLPSSLNRINRHINQTFLCVQEASQTSPAWSAYLQQIDSVILTGLKNMLFKIISALVQKAARYEQGASISPLVTVQLELQGDSVNFSPPLSVQSALSSVPEVVQRWLNDYIGLAKLVRRVCVFGRQGEEREGEERERELKERDVFEDGTYFTAVSSDADIKAAFGKVSAHLETNSRQCQSLRKRFSIYGFLWEQDVSATFTEFMKGQGAPHPRRFTRPETVRSRASARVHSGRPRSHTSSHSQLITPAPEQSLLGVMGVSDWDFLCPAEELGSLDMDEDTSKRPSLDDFDGEIAVFQGVLDRLSNIEDIASVGWIEVDQRPVKQALTAMASKWKYTYASYLERQISSVLFSLERFFTEIEPAVEAITGEESDTQAFMKLMGIFNRVNSQQLEMDTKFGAVHRAVIMLDNFSYPLPAHVRTQFNNAPQRWSNLKKRVALGKQRIGPRIQAKGDVISQDLSRFGEIFSSLKDRFDVSKCLRYDCHKDKALDLVSEFCQELRELQGEAKELIELQELLETSVFNFSLLKKFEEELSTLQELWSVSEIISDKHSSWHSLKWRAIDTSDLLLETDRQHNLVSTLPLSIVRPWDLHRLTVESVHAVQTLAPILEGLRSPSMRPRHWKQVLRLAKPGGPVHLLGRGGSVDPGTLEDLTLGQLLGLGLHNHPEEVQAIVERADKDIAIESLLNTFEEVWLSRQLELRPHRRLLDSAAQETISELGIDSVGQTSSTPKSSGPLGRVTSAVRRRGGATQSIGASGRVSTLSTTPSRENAPRQCVLLLRNSGGIFETLENHQLSLQSLEGTVAAVSFTEDLNKWHKQLQTIEAVLTTWLKVQLLWVQLEEVYGSSEVQQHLPTHAYTFSNVDKEWRELMKQTSKNPAVINVCLKEDLLPSLEKLHSSLNQCQAALVRYVEGQRSKCPWFYFLPLEDILQFVCYGSSLQQLSAHIPKLLHYAGGLTFDNVAPVSNLSSERVTPYPAHSVRGGVNQITGIVSVAGETMSLNQGVVCEGPVEGIISQLIKSLSSSLHSHLTNVMANHILPSPDPHRSSGPPFTSLVDLPTVWQSTVATQISILATQIALELAVNEALKDGTTSTKLVENLLEEIERLTNFAVTLLKGKPLQYDDIVEPHPSNSVQHQSSSRKQDNTTVTQDSGDIHEDEKSETVLVAKHRVKKLESIVMVLASFRYKIEGVLSILPTVRNVANSFHWQSLLHYEWSVHDSQAFISSLGSSLSYGYRYTGSACRLVLTPAMERSLGFLLEAVREGNSGVVLGREEMTKSSLIEELAVCVGQTMFSVHCTPLVSHDIILNCIKGIASTGCWLLFRSLDTLPPAVLQTTSTLLAELKDACINNKTSFQAIGESIRLSPDECGVCFAIPSDYSVASPSNLPVSLLEMFKTCSVNKLERKLILEAFFLSSQFETASSLADNLDKFCCALQELFPLNFTPLIPDTDCSTTPSPVLLSLYRLKSIAALAGTFMREFESFAALGEESSPQLATGPLHMASLVFSEVSLSSLKFFTDSSQQKGHQRQSLEEFSLVLSLKDTVLSSFDSSSREHSVVVKLIGDIFPNCDLGALLSHELSVREGLEVKSREDKGAAESARESRAASAMQMVQDDHLQTSEVAIEMSFEQQIVQTCQTRHMIPTQLFQTAVSQLVTLVQQHQFVAVCGPSCSGKTAAIQTAVETLRLLASPSNRPCHITCTTLSVGSMREEQLLGFKTEGESLWQDGVLTHLLNVDNSLDHTSLKDSIQWFVLDGDLSTAQLDTLLSSLGPMSSLHLSNGRAVQLSESTRFILELKDLSQLSPSSATEIGKVFMSANTIQWRDITLSWVNEKSFGNSEAIEALFDKYLPQVIVYLRPVLAGSMAVDGQAGGGGSTVSMLRNEIEPQDVMLSEVHLINTCCQILESLLECVSPGQCVPSPLSLELCLIYSIVWSFGGFLSRQNKITFDQWWRNTFNQSNRLLCFPEHGLIYDYYTKLGTEGFLAWRDVLRSKDIDNSFIPNLRVAAVQNLIDRLISRGSSVLLVGPQGSGKTSLLQQLFSDRHSSCVKDTSLLHVYTNHLTSAAVVWGQMLDNLEWDWGRRYTPKNSKKLVCFIDDIHNTEIQSLCEMVSHHLSTGSVCDPDTNKWHSVSDVSYVITYDPTSHVKLPSNFMKHFTVIHWDQYSSDEMVDIFSTMLTATQRHHPRQDRLDPSVVHSLVQTAVQVHRKLGSMFLATRERLHYVFTMSQISTLFKKLCSIVAVDTIKSHDLVLLWQRESWWMYGGALSSELDRERYREAVCHALNKYFNEDPMLPQYLHEDSLRLPVKSVDEWRARLSHELTEYNILHSPIHFNLYDSAVELVHHLCHVINSPFDRGHMMILGHAHPESLVHLSSLHCGYTLVKPSQYFSQSLLSSSAHSGMSINTYSLKQLRRDLLTVYTTAGVKNEKIVVLLTDKEILDESFLTCVYEFVKGGAITPLFSKEEQARVVNAVRSDMTQMGVAFTRQTGWEFFIGRVRSNVRVVLSLSSLSQCVRSGCHRWRELFGSTQIYSYLPWERKELVSVATHHLRGCEYLQEEQVDSLAHLLASIHLQLRLREGVFATNTNYEYYIERFVHELNGMHSISQSKCSKLSSALSCVERASSQVSALQDKIKRESVILEEKRDACVKLLVQIGQDTAISHQHNKLVTRQRERIAHLKKVVPDFEHAYNIALQEKENLIDGLKVIVATMDRGSLSELRALQRAPQEVEELLVAVIVVMKGPTADFSWTKGAKRLMANLDRFTELMLEFSSCEDNSEILLESLDPLIEKTSFSPDIYLEQPVGGKAASQLCGWVQGVHRLHNKLQTTLRPLQSRVASMKASLSEYSDKLYHQENKVSVLDNRLKVLSISLENASVEKSKQHDLVNKMKKELNETRGFIESLSGVHDRWRLEMREASMAVTTSVGALCLSVTTLSYLAPLQPHQQMEVINDQLVPLFEERGVKLCWRKDTNSLSNMLKRVSQCIEEQTSSNGEAVVSKVDSCTGEINLSPSQNPSSSQNGCDSALTDCSKDALSLSYASSTSKLASLLVDETFLDKWLTSSCTSSSLSFMLPCALVHAAWHRWPLVCDRHRFASMWIREYVGDGLVCLDGRDRSSTFFITLEQAVVKGSRVLIEHFPSPMDPALQPLIEISNDRESAKMVHFCGHRLHIHRSFQLFMTTTAHPGHISPSLASQVTVINFPTSLPLAEDLLVETAFNMATGSGDEFREVSRGIASCREKLNVLDEELFGKLPMHEKEGCYWWSTEKITNIVSKKNEVLKTMTELTERFATYCSLRALLVPLAKHAALVHCILSRLEESDPLHSHNWEQFEDLFKNTLQTHLKDRPLLTVDNSGEVVNVGIEHFNHAVLRQAIQYLDHHSWLQLASGVALLSLSTPTSLNNSLLLVEQLLYLAHGESYLQELDLTLEDERPPSPACISQDVWRALHKIPLSTEYFSVVIKSIHDDAAFWESLTAPDKMADLQQELTEFPWKTSDFSPPLPTGLDECVMLNCLCPQVVAGKLLATAGKVVDSTDVPELREIVRTESRPRPLLLLHDVECPVSQANAMELESELNKCLPGKSIHVVQMCAGIEDAISPLLSQPKCDCLLITNIDLASQQWLELLPWRMRESAHSGCLMVFTAQVSSPHTSALPSDFVTLCRTASLSNIAFTSSKALPKCLWTNEEKDIFSLIGLCFTTLSPAISAKCDTLADILKPALFNLAVFHAATVATRSLNRSIRTLALPHISQFTGCVEELLALTRHGGSGPRMDPSVVLKALMAHVREVYSHTLSQDKLDELLEACLSEEVAKPSARVKLASMQDGLEVTVPSQAVSLKMFGDHVRGLMDAANQQAKEQSLRFADIAESVEALLVPVLTQIPSPDLYNATPPSTTNYTPHGKATMDMLDYCKEQLPGLLERDSVMVDALKEKLTREMKTCSQLSSTEDYLEHRRDTLVTEYNSVVSTIKKDLAILSRHATTGFDGLPASLRHVLNSVQDNKMPVKWNKLLADSSCYTLREGLQVLQKLHSNLTHKNN